MPNRPTPSLRAGGYVQLHLVRHRETGDLYIVEELLKPAAHKRIVLAVAGPILAARVCTAPGSIAPSWVARWRNEHTELLRPELVPWALTQPWEWLAGHVVPDADPMRSGRHQPVVAWSGQGVPLQQEIGAARPPLWVYSAFPS